MTTKQKVRDGSTMPRNVASSKAIATRNLKIKEAARAGVPRATLARRYDLTEGRICQIIKNPNAAHYYEYV